MKITYNWLKEFVDIKLKPAQIADKLTMAGIEVKGIEEKNADYVFEIEITSNRPDWLSAVGLAREVAAITGQKIKKLPAISRQPSKKNKEKFDIVVEDMKDCPLYTAKIIRDVKVAESVDWLREKLELIGCRSINNIVDITNYAMFSYGEPLHAFDLDKIQGGKVVVRRARTGEKLITIDGVERTLDAGILVIADAFRPIAIAGVMGGKETEVTFNTKNILLEAAQFNQVMVRRSRQKLALQTDSSYRFERGIDFVTVRNTSQEAASLINRIAGGKCELEKASSSVALKNKTIEININSLADIIGIKISAVKIKSILTALGFKLKNKGKSGFFVEIPAYRADVSLEIDLVEEIARIYGFENIPVSLPKFVPQINKAGSSRLVPYIKEVLVGLGLNEAITYSLIDKNSLKGFYADEIKLLEILNPLSKDQELLRPTLMPSLLKAVAYNLNQKQEPVELFEIGNTYIALDNKSTLENPSLCIALCGTNSLLLENGAVKEKLGVFHLKGILETVFNNLGIKDFSFASPDETGKSNIFAGNQEKVGELFIIPDQILNVFEIKNKSAVIAEIDLSKIAARMDLKKRFLGLPLYPGVTRDISLQIKEDVLVQGILDLIKKQSGGLLEEVKVVDYYKGKQIPHGFKGVTVSCLYRSKERTLTEEEVNPLYSSACSALVESFGAKLR